MLNFSFKANVITRTLEAGEESGGFEVTLIEEGSWHETTWHPEERNQTHFSLTFQRICLQIPSQAVLLSVTQLPAPGYSPDNHHELKMAASLRQQRTQK